MGQTERGTLVTWKADRFFGFIRPDGYTARDRDCFVYGQELPDWVEPEVGLQLEFVRGTDDRGRVRAEQVVLAR